MNPLAETHRLLGGRIVHSSFGINIFPQRLHGSRGGAFLIVVVRGRAGGRTDDVAAGQGSPASAPLRTRER
jgi:hypothetical protein